ncbi:MAG: hypothetical protein ACYCZV_15540 [Acidimicrobiales bacterium]
MPWTRRALRMGAGLVVGLVVLADLGAPARAAVVPLDQAVLLSDPGVGLVAPHDGRIRVPGFAAKVLGAAFTYRAGPAGQTITAPAGDYLCVFELEITAVNPDGTAGSSLSGLNVLATVGAERVVVNTSAMASGRGTQTYALAVPKKAPVGLELSVANFSQDYSLSRLALVPPAPEVLYRDTSNPEVDLAIQSDQNLAVASPDGSITGTVPLDLNSVTLSYLSPDLDQPPPGGASQAYLSLGLSSPYDGVSATYQGGGVALDPITTLTPGELSLVLPGGAAVAAQHSGPTAKPQGDLTDSGLVEGTYYFVVPAGITSAQLMVNPKPNEMTATYGLESANLAMSIAKATFPVSFPAPVAMGAPGPALTIPTVPVAVRLGGAGTALWLIVLLAVLAAAVALWAWRRRYRPAIGLPAYVAWSPDGPRTSADRTLLFVRYESRPQGERDAEIAPPAALTAADEGPAIALPPASPARRLTVRLLGPLGVEGLRGEPEPRLVQMLAVLALAYPSSVSSDEVRNVLGGDFFEKRRPSVHNDFSRLRRHLPPGVLPSARGKAGYRLKGDVSIDLAEFRRLVAEGARVTGAPRRALQADALRLVEGVPLAYIEIDALAARGIALATEVEIVAVELAGAALAEGEAELAEFAAERGLRAQPQCERLWHLRSAAADAGSGLSPSAVWAAARRILGEEAAARLRARYDAASRAGS